MVLFPPEIAILSQEKRGIDYLQPRNIQGLPSLSYRRQCCYFYSIASRQTRLRILVGALRYCTVLGPIDVQLRSSLHLEPSH